MVVIGCTTLWANRRRIKGQLSSEREEKLRQRETGRFRTYNLAGTEKGGLSTGVSQAHVELSDMSFHIGVICIPGLSKVY